MATAIDITSITMDAKKMQSFSEFVNELMYERAAIESIHGPVKTGIKTTTQIILAGLMGKTGIADPGCTRPTSGAKSELTELFWTPGNVGDTWAMCQAELDQLFEPYINELNAYADKFDFSGSEEEKFVASKITESAAAAIHRHIWFGDKSVAVATATDAGVTGAALVKFYNVIDGLWKQIFARVTSGALGYVPIDENTQATAALQLELSAGRSKELFNAIWKKADPRLRASKSSQFLVSGEIFNNYRTLIQDSTLAFNPTYTMDGLEYLTWNGKPIVNMETIWDLDLRGDFVKNTAENSLYRPNRILFTTKENIPVGTLNDGDFNELKSWYNEDERVNKMAYGFTLDAKYIANYLGVVAF